MMERRGLLRLGGLLALAAVLILAGAGVPATAQAPGDEPLARFAPAMLPEFVGDLAAHAHAPHYTIDMALALTPTQAVIDGYQRVRYTNRAPDALDEIVFRLYPNLESYGGKLLVLRVTVDGHTVTPHLDATGTVLRVPLPAPLAPGAATTLALDYELTIWEGRVRLYAQFSYLDGVLALPNAYPVLSVYEPGNGWWDVTDHAQGDAVYSQTAFYEVTITAPEDLVFATSGIEIAQHAGAEGTLVHEYIAPLMRDFAIFASTHYVTLNGEQDGTTIRISYDPARVNAEFNAFVALRVTQEAVKLFNTTFGAYPFAELDVVQTPTRAGGVEYPGLFVVGDRLWDENGDNFLFVIVHETAHQWWYSLVGNDQTLDPWMDEALAQFATALFIRDLEGEASFEAAMEAYLAQYTRFLALATGLDRPIGLPASAYDATAYYYLVYQKGPLFFGALADTYGLEAVLAALRDYFAAYRYRIAEPADMLASFERSLGADLDDVFAEWVGAFPVG